MNIDKFVINSDYLFYAIIIVSMALVVQAYEILRGGLSIFYLSLLTYLIFVVLDILTTYLIVSNKRGRERNPIADIFFKKIGIIKGSLILKHLGLVGLYFLSKFSSINIELVLLLAITAGTIVVLNNIIVYFSIKKHYVR